MSFFQMKAYQDYMRFDKFIEIYINRFIKEDKSLLLHKYNWKIEVKNFTINFTIKCSFDNFKNWTIDNVEQLHNDLTDKCTKIRDELLVKLNNCILQVHETLFDINKYRIKDIERKVHLSLKISKESLENLYNISIIEGYHITDYKK